MKTYSSDTSKAFPFCELLDMKDSYHTTLLFIHEKSSAIYRIADHTSLGNIPRTMGTNPIRYNAYEKMTHKERKEKSKYV